MVTLVSLLVIVPLAAAGVPDGMRIGSVSEPLKAADGSEYLIFLPPKFNAKNSHPVLLFLHGVGGINNAKGCRDPGLTTQLPLLNQSYAAKVEHIVLVPVAKRPNWRHHFDSAMALVNMALSELGGDPQRVSIAGQSMGAHGAYLYASQLAPGRFAAVAVMCGYLEEEAPLNRAQSMATPLNEAWSKVVEPLNATPVWVFHSDEDDAVPPPGRAQDDGRAVVAALLRAGNGAVKFSHYPLGRKPLHYVAGHAAFEFAFAEEGLWPWLSAARLSSGELPPPSSVTAPWRDLMGVKEHEAVVVAALSMLSIVACYLYIRFMLVEPPAARPTRAGLRPQPRKAGKQD